MTGIKTLQKGFTLVELLVSIFLFSTIMIVSVSMFVYALDLQRKAFNIQKTEESASFIMESMLKELRVSEITLPLDDTDCPSSPSSSISVMHPDLGAITYDLEGTSLRKNGQIVSSNAIEFTKLGFCVTGAQGGDYKQPRVTIMAGLRSSSTKQQSLIDIETSISPRTIND